MIKNCKGLKSFVSSCAEIITYDKRKNNFSPKIKFVTISVLNFSVLNYGESEGNHIHLRSTPNEIRNEYDDLFL